VTRGFVRS